MNGQSVNRDEGAPLPASKPSVDIVILRLALSGVVIYLAWSLVGLSRAVLSRTRAEPYAANTVQREQERDQRASVRRSISFPWPRYPGARETRRGQIDFNGVPVVEQTLVARASPEKILRFYRTAMAARGWRDNTEAFYQVRPALLQRHGMPRNLQDENFLRRFDTVKRSKLSLVRRNKSVLVEIRPGERRRQVIALHYVGSSTLFNLVEDMAKAAQNPVRDTVPFLAASSAPGQPTAGSKLYYSQHRPSRFFQRMEQMLEGEGWTRVELPAPIHASGREAEFAGLFTREDRVASLAVSATGEEGGATAIVTETPR